MRDIMVEPIETWFHASFESYYHARYNTDQATKDANVIENIIAICVPNARCDGGATTDTLRPSSLGSNYLARDSTKLDDSKERFLILFLSIL